MMTNDEDEESSNVYMNPKTAKSEKTRWEIKNKNNVCTFRDYEHAKLYQKICQIEEKLEEQDEEDDGVMPTGMDRVLMFSGGKDSTYLLWYCIEKHIKFDRVVFCDTTLKLPIEYSWIDCIEDYFNVNIERRKPKQKFKDKFYQVHKTGKDEGKIWGLPYVSCPCWILRDMKLKNMKDVDGEFLLGYTADENRGLKNVDYDAPLQEAGITAKQVIRELKAANFYPPIYKLLEKRGGGCVSLEAVVFYVLRLRRGGLRCCIMSFRFILRRLGCLLRWMIRSCLSRIDRLRILKKRLRARQD